MDISLRDDQTWRSLQLETRYRMGMFVKFATHDLWIAARRHTMENLSIYENTYLCDLTRGLAGTR